MRWEKKPFLPEGQEARDALETCRCDGIGFMFCSGDPFVGIDLGNCRDPETGEVEGWARSILESFENAVHVEVSPSGTGIHIIARGTQRNGIKRGNIEIYGQDRFFTVTGVLL